LLISFRRFVITVLLLTGVGTVGAAFAGSAKAKTFASASQASQALYEAVRANDGSAIQAILGAGPELISSGNQDNDKLDRQGFVNKYQEMHRLVREPDGNTVLYIGAENWPFPFPLVEKDGKWHFDADEGGQEVLARDIGRNEVAAIKVCEAFSDGTRGGADVSGNDESIVQFAAGLRNQNETKGGNAIPFDGYYFRVVENKPAGGVLVAYPAEYGLTGVMTFMVTPSGSVYENDLGVQSAKEAQQVEGNPTQDWAPVRQTSM
jgi:hypothetical protein